MGVFFKLFDNSPKTPFKKILPNRTPEKKHFTLEKEWSVRRDCELTRVPPARLAFQAGIASLPRFSQKLGSLLGFKSQ